ncbi:hypothetical protein MKX03_033987 [Papaver bracteatum]|nr:hypothetical protein MKX03_033987 [Papaver bracteatum]
MVREKINVSAEGRIPSPISVLFSIFSIYTAMFFWQRHTCCIHISNSRLISQYISRQANMHTLFWVAINDLCAHGDEIAIRNTKGLEKLNGSKHEIEIYSTLATIRKLENEFCYT